MALRSVLTAFLLLSTQAFAAGPAKPGEDPVQATLLASTEAAVPGETFTLGVLLKIQPHWHTYWLNPGENGAPTTIQLSAPDGFTFGDIRWPLPKQIAAPGGISFGYEDAVLLQIPVTVAKDVALGKATIAADVKWLVCQDTCIPGMAKLSLNLPIAASAKAANADLFNHWAGQLPVSQADASQALPKVTQTSGDDGTPVSALTVEWRNPPKKLEWFPVATPAVAIDNVQLKQEGNTTTISFESTIYKPEAVPEGLIDSLLVFEDEQGNRRGISVPVRLPKAP